jgi:hypothetical protein
MQDGDQNGYQYLTENFKDPRDFPFVFKKIMVQTNIKVLKNRSSCKKGLNDIGNRDSKKDNFMKQDTLGILTTRDSTYRVN